MSPERRSALLHDIRCLRPSYASDEIANDMEQLRAACVSDKTIAKYAIDGKYMRYVVKMIKPSGHFWAQEDCGSPAEAAMRVFEFLNGGTRPGWSVTITAYRHDA